jgi:hypothetical protein
MGDSIFQIKEETEVTKKYRYILYAYITVGAVQYNTIRYDMIQYDTVKYTSRTLGVYRCLPYMMMYTTHAFVPCSVSDIYLDYNFEPVNIPRKACFAPSFLNSSCY